MPFNAEVQPKIRIVHLISSLGKGGSEMMLYKLIPRMNPSRFINSVISMTDEGELGPEMKAAGIPVHTLGMKRGRPTVQSLWRLHHLLRKDRPDILQTWLYHADLLGLIGSTLARVPVLSWNIRCSDVDWSHYSMLSRLIVHALANLSTLPDAVVVNSEAGLRVHRDLNYRPRRWEVVPNGFDLEAFHPDRSSRAKFRQTLGLNPETILIGLIARYDPLKDHQTFLRGIPYLLKEFPATHFILAGLGIDASNAKLMSTVRELGISEHVHLLGPQSHVASLLPALDIVSLSSISEGFPNVLGEAMACGVPCVATNAGDSATIIGETGQVVPTRNPKALAEAWARMIALDPEVRERLGSAARRRIEEHYGLPAIVARYENLYQELIPCAALPAS